MPKRYIRVNDRRVGLRPAARRTISRGKANQWSITPKQIDFARRYFSPTSKTYSNAYESAIQAGYQKSTAVKIMSNSTDLEWIREARKYLIDFKPDHIKKAYENIYLEAPRYSDKLNALDSLAKISGMFIDRSINTNIDVKFTNDVPRPVLGATYSVPEVIDSTTTPSTPVK